MSKIKIFNNKVFRNSSWMLAQQIFSMLISLIVGSISARYLGPSNYGTLSYTTSLITLATSFAKLGLDSIVVKNIVTCVDEEEEKIIVGSTLILRIISSCLAFIIVNCFAIIFHSNETVLNWIIFIQSFQLFFDVFDVFSMYFQAKMNYKYIAVSLIIAALISNTAKLLLTIMKIDLIFFPIIPVVQSFFSIALLVIFFFFISKGRIRVSFDKAFFLLKQSYHLFLSTIAITVYTQIDRIMIKGFLSDEAVGYYTAATTVAMLWEFVPQTIIQAFQPEIYKNVDNPEKFNRIMNKATTVIVLLSVFVIICYMLLGNIAVDILYGKDFTSSKGPMKIVAISTAFAMLSCLRSPWLVANGVYKYDKYCVLFGAISNFLLNLIFIPRFGIWGAAITTLIAQVMNGIVATLIFKKTRPYLKYIINVPVEIIHFFRKDIE